MSLEQFPSRIAIFLLIANIAVDKPKRVWKAAPVDETNSIA
jgi:hypothetical protein